jgi:adenylate kinase
MRYALTGTPGVGKTTVAAILSLHGVPTMEVGELARREGLILGLDEGRGSYDVDLDALRAHSSGIPDGVVLVGHLSHLLDVGGIIVLRCSPSVLAARLRERGYALPKVMENVEAEAVDVILIEAVESGAAVFEIDTTYGSPDEVARSVLQILGGEKTKYLPGHVDWSQEI